MWALQPKCWVAQEGRPELEGLVQNPNLDFFCSFPRSRTPNIARNPFLDTLQRCQRAKVVVGPVREVPVPVPVPAPVPVPVQMLLPPPLRRLTGIPARRTFRSLRKCTLTTV